VSNKKNHQTLYSIVYVCRKKERKKERKQEKNAEKKKEKKKKERKKKKKGVLVWDKMIDSDSLHISYMTHNTL
jgi:hypothetical protein